MTAESMDIDEFRKLAQQVVEKEVPEDLLKALNLGITVLPDLYEEDESVIMGEYVVNELGNLIVLYYGSFAAYLENAPRSSWMEEIRDTIKHELQHHIEDMAGEETLARMEEEMDFFEGEND